MTTDDKKNQKVGDRWRMLDFKPKRAELTIRDHGGRI